MPGCCNSWGRKELDTTERLNWNWKWGAPKKENALVLMTVDNGGKNTKE